MRFSLRQSKMLLVFFTLVAFSIPFAAFAGEGGPDESLRGPGVVANFVFTDVSGAAYVEGTLRCGNDVVEIGPPPVPSGHAFSSVTLNDGANLVGGLIPALATIGCNTVGDLRIIAQHSFNQITPSMVSVSVVALYIQGS
jgi:hypothetical protein